MMFRSKWSSLFRRYFSITAVILLVSFFVMGFALLWSAANYWSDKQLDLLERNAKNLQEMFTKLQGDADMFETTDLDDAAMVREMMAIVFLATTQQNINADVFICDAQGKVTLCSDRIHSLNPSGAQCGHRVYQVSVESMKNVELGQLESIGLLDGCYREKRFIAAEPLFAEDEYRGAVFITQPTSQNRWTDILAIFWRFLAAALISLSLAFFAIYLVTYQLTKPLSDMSKAAKQYAKGDFTERIRYRGLKRRIKSGDELGELVEEFNSMATALSKLEFTRRSFVANVSHELKTPMTTIGGFIDGILDGTIHPQDHKRYLRTVSEEVKRLSRLVTGMLNMSKIEAGEMELKPVKFDVVQMLFRSLLSFEQILEKKNVSISGFEELGMVLILADEDMIHQVVYNLVDNAVKFVQEGGSISVNVDAQEERTFVRVRNSGAGIPQEEIGNIFERFYKVDKSRSYDARSAGLGLYIVKSIVELHGGRITAESVQGVYTEFCFWLPNRTESEQ